MGISQDPRTSGAGGGRGQKQEKVGVDFAKVLHEYMRQVHDKAPNLSRCEFELAGVVVPPGRDTPLIAAPSKVPHTPNPLFWVREAAGSTSEGSK